MDTEHALIMFNYENWFTKEVNDDSLHAEKVVNHFINTFKHYGTPGTGEEANAYKIEGILFFKSCFDKSVDEPNVNFNPFVAAYYCMCYLKYQLDPDDYQDYISDDESGVVRDFATDIYGMMRAYYNPQIILDFMQQCSHTIHRNLAFAMISHERLCERKHSIQLKPDMIKKICMMEHADCEEYKVIIANELREEYADFVYKNLERYERVFRARRSWNDFARDVKGVM